MAGVFSGLVKSTLSSLVGSVVGSKEFPYTVGDRVPALNSQESVWALHTGECATDSSPVSILVYEKAQGSTGQLALARNAFSRHRTIRHPGLLRYVNGVETDTHIYLVTDSIKPLKSVLNDDRNDNLLVWGLYNIAMMIHFLNNDCGLVHGNLRISSIFVNEAGEWKLGGLELLSALKDEQPFIVSNAMMIPDAKHYATPEVARSNWDAMKEYSPSATDAWQYACFIYEVFNGAFSQSTQLRTSGKIPQSLRQPYLSLLDPNPRSRPSLGRFLEHGKRSGGYFDSDFLQINQFMDEFNVKDEHEREAFLSTLGPKISSFPVSFNRRKLLPELLKVLEFGSGGSKVIEPVAQISAQLEEHEYRTLVAPAISRLFALPDRSIRLGLLVHLGAFVRHITAKAASSEIFPHYVTGFTDSAPIVRDATVRGALALAPKLSDKVNNNELSKYVCKAMMDPEPGIRTNAVVCIGKLSQHMNVSTRTGTLLPTLFGALRDPFPAARSAALLAITATLDDYAASEYAGKILPQIAPLLVDPYREVRTNAFKATEQLLQKLQLFAANMPDAPSPSAATTAVGTLGAGSDRALSQAGGAVAVGAEWAGWAVSSVAKKLSDVAFVAADGGSTAARQAQSAPTTPTAPTSITKSTSLASDASYEAQKASIVMSGWDDQDIEFEDASMGDDAEIEQHRPTSLPASTKKRSGMRLGRATTEATNLLAEIQGDEWDNDGWGLEDPFAEQAGAKHGQTAHPHATSAGTTRTDELDQRREERRQRMAEQRERRKQQATPRGRKL